jgi:PAS domain S-box-containing protein
MAAAAMSRGPGGARRDTGRIERLIVAGVFIIVTAGVAELAFRQEAWPWMAATAGCFGLAALAVLAYRRHDLRYRRLLDRVPVGLYRTAPDGRIVDVNPALARIFGFESPSEMLASPARSVYCDPADRERWVAQVNQAAGPVETELRMRRRDGTAIWVRDRVVPVRDRRGRILYYEGQLEDVTAEKHHREELEAALRSKIELIGTVSHELRNPLTSILGYAHMLSVAPDADPAERAEMAAVVKQQAEDVANLVDDLLTAAQADAGTLRVMPGPLDLAEEVARVLAGLRGRHAGTLELDAAAAPALGDPMRVRQIVRNLVTNAIVHGGEHIRVTTSRNARQARLVVADDGPGLAAGDEERAFEPFQHGNRETRGHNSVGLGLTISRQLARMMGGDLQYRRQKGQTLFELILPGRPVTTARRLPRALEKAAAPVG